MTEDELLQGYAKHARPVMRRFMRSQACINATRVTCQFFERYQMSALPVPCKFAFKVPARQYRYMAGWASHEKRQLKRMAGAWSDRTPRGPTWVVHLVALVQGRYLIDACIDNVTSPEDAVVMPPIALVIDLGQQARIALTGTVTAGVTLEDGSPAEITYVSSDDHSFLTSAAWLDDVEAKGIAHLIQLAIEGRLKGDRSTSSLLVP